MTKPFHVLHIVPALFGPNDGITGGAERYVFELARHMAEEVPTSLVSFGDKPRRETVGRLSIRVIKDPWYVKGQRTNPIALSLFSELFGADIVHCHQQHLLASSLVALACRVSRRPVFVSELGGGGWDLSAFVPTDRWYDGHLHISDYSRQIHGHGDKSWASVILGGVDIEKFSPDESVVRQPKVLFVGRILPHKGIDDLIRALPPELPLEIIGQPYDERYMADLRIAARGKQVSFIHDCDDDALVKAYRSAMCMVLPSVYRNMYGGETKTPELLGQTLLEGMACGTPAICTNVASMPEVIEDRVTGFVVPPNDATALSEKLNWLLENPAAARTMGEAGRRRVLEKFTWPMVVRRCLEIYAG
jgi:glycosyltransferase involved in cell wall biosynthesis